jgi:hypothetical protein
MGATCREDGVMGVPVGGEPGHSSLKTFSFLIAFLRKQGLDRARIWHRWQCGAVCRAARAYPGRRHVTYSHLVTNRDQSAAVAGNSMAAVFNLSTARNGSIPPCKCRRIFSEWQSDARENGVKLPFVSFLCANQWVGVCFFRPLLAVRHTQPTSPHKRRRCQTGFHKQSSTQCKIVALSAPPVPITLHSRNPSRVRCPCCSRCLA